MHDRIPHDRHLEDVRAVDLRAVRELGGELCEAAADDLRELLLRAGVEHDVGDAAHEVLAEADLRVHLSGRSQHLSGEEVAQVARNSRRADVEGDPVRAIVQAGPRGRDRRAVVNRDRDRARFFEDRALQFGEDGRVGVEPVELPLRRERLPHTPQVTRRDPQLGARDLDVVEPHDRVDLDGMCVRFLADDLAVELALGRHIDDDVTCDTRGAAETSPAREAAVGGVALLDLGRG